MESDEDTFTLQVTDDSGLEDDNGEIKERNSLINADSLNEKNKTFKIRLLSDIYYEDDDDDEDNSEIDNSNSEKLDSNIQAQEKEKEKVEENYTESFSEQVGNDQDKRTENVCLEEPSVEINDNSQLEFSLKDFIEQEGSQIGADNIETEDSRIQDIDNTGKLSEVGLKDNEDIYLTDKQWEYLQNGDVLNGEIDVNLNLADQQALEDFELLLIQEKNQACTQPENINLEEVNGQQSLDNFELIMDQDNNQNNLQVEIVNQQVEADQQVNLGQQQVLKYLESLISQDQTYSQVDNVCQDLEDGEIQEKVAETPCRSRSDSVELIEVSDKVTARLFSTISSDEDDDNFPVISPEDDYNNSAYEPRNPSPPEDGQFSTMGDDDPWDNLKSLSDDCVIVDEIKHPCRSPRSHTGLDKNLEDTRQDQRNEHHDKFEDRRKKLRKRRSSTLSNYDDCTGPTVNNKHKNVNYDDFTGICSKDEVSELPEDYDERVSKKKKHYGRDEDHPLYRDIDAEFSEKLMQVKNQGYIIIRPSSKGPDYLKITWKVTDGIYQNIKVKKKLKASSPTKYRYWINSRDFKNLDEIVTLYITPMAQHVLKLLEYKHFKKGLNGIKAAAEELLKAEKNRNPNCIPYNISAVKKSPGKFLISYLPKITCYHEYIKVVPEGFRFRDQPFDSLTDLLIYFKANSKEVKPLVLRDETVSSTLSRPSTPRPLTPRPSTPRPSTPRPSTPRPSTPRPLTPRPSAPGINELTPSILEVIQGLPDENLESIKQILDRLAQSTNNQPRPAFNQNLAPPRFVFNGYPQPYPPIAYPTPLYPRYQPNFGPGGIPMPVPPVPVPHPQNMDLPVPNFNKKTAIGPQDLPLPPGTN